MTRQIKENVEVKPLYYYTSVSVMQSILTEGTIWATNILYMNDSEEYKNGLRELEPLIEDHCADEKQKTQFKNYIQQQLIEPNTNYYSISFSGQPDLLSQWAMYARESGVNLEFDFNILKGKYCSPELRTECGKAVEYTEMEYQPIQVQYFTKAKMEKETQRKDCRITKEDIERTEKEIKARVLDSSVDAIFDGKMLLDGWKNNLFRHVALIKRFEFYLEDEWRLVYKDSLFRPKYRKDGNVLKPYLPIQCKKANEESSLPWPVVAVTVGPGHDQQTVFESIKHFLNCGPLKALPEELFESNFRKYLGELRDRTVKNRSMHKNIKNILNGLNKRTREQSYNLLNWTISNSGATEDVKDFLKNNYFSEHGVILRRSEIPYIF